MDDKLRTYATSMRREPTPAEARLWSSLRGRRLDGLKFRRQVPVGPYIADFLCKDLKLIVEVDGGQHAENSYDRRRDEWLAAHGWRVLRLWNDHVMGDVESALEHIRIAASGGVPPG